MSNVTFSGIVGKPEQRFTPSGKAVLQFSVGLYTGGNKENGYADRAWIRVEAWDELAELPINKGETDTVIGQAKTPRKWTDKEGNERDAGFEVVAREIIKGDTYKVGAVQENEEYPF